MSSPSHSNDLEPAHGPLAGESSPRSVDTPISIASQGAAKKTVQPLSSSFSRDIREQRSTSMVLTPLGRNNRSSSRSPTHTTRVDISYATRLLSFTDALLRGAIGPASGGGVVLDPDHETGLHFASITDTEVAAQRWLPVVESIVSAAANPTSMNTPVVTEFVFALAHFLFKLSLGPVASQLVMNDAAVVPCVTKCLEAARAIQSYEPLEEATPMYPHHPHLAPPHAHPSHHHLTSPSAAAAGSIMSSGFQTLVQEATKSLAMVVTTFCPQMQTSLDALAAAWLDTVNASGLSAAASSAACSALLFVTRTFLCDEDTFVTCAPGFFQSGCVDMSRRAIAAFLTGDDAIADVLRRGYPEHILSCVSWLGAPTKLWAGLEEAPWFAILRLKHRFPLDHLLAIVPFCSKYPPIGVVVTHLLGATDSTTTAHGSTQWTNVAMGTSKALLQVTEVDRIPLIQHFRSFLAYLLVASPPFANMYANTLHEELRAAREAAANVAAIVQKHHEEGPSGGVEGPTTATTTTTTSAATTAAAATTTVSRGGGRGSSSSVGGQHHMTAAAAAPPCMLLFAAQLVACCSVSILPLPFRSDVILKASAVVQAVFDQLEAVQFGSARVLSTPLAKSIPTMEDLKLVKSHYGAAVKALARYRVKQILPKFGVASAVAHGAQVLNNARRRESSKRAAGTRSPLSNGKGQGQAALQRHDGSNAFAESSIQLSHLPSALQRIRGRGGSPPTTSPSRQKAPKFLPAMEFGSQTSMVLEMTPQRQHSEDLFKNRMRTAIKNREPARLRRKLEADILKQTQKEDELHAHRTDIAEKGRTIRHLATLSTAWEAVLERDAQRNKRKGDPANLDEAIEQALTPRTHELLREAKREYREYHKTHPQTKIDSRSPRPHSTSPHRGKKDEQPGRSSTSLSQHPPPQTKKKLPAVMRNIAAARGATRTAASSSPQQLDAAKSPDVAAENQTQEAKRSPPPPKKKSPQPAPRPVIRSVAKKVPDAPPPKPLPKPKPAKKKPVVTPSQAEQQTTAAPTSPSSSSKSTPATPPLEPLQRSPPPATIGVAQAVHVDDSARSRSQSPKSAASYSSSASRKSSPASRSTTPVRDDDAMPSAHADEPTELSVAPPPEMANPTSPTPTSSGKRTPTPTTPPQGATEQPAQSQGAASVEPSALPPLETPTQHAALTEEAVVQQGETTRTLLATPSLDTVEPLKATSPVGESVSQLPTHADQDDTTNVSYAAPSSTQSTEPQLPATPPAEAVVASRPPTPSVSAAAPDAQTPPPTPPHASVEPAQAEGEILQTTQEVAAQPTEPLLPASESDTMVAKDIASQEPVEVPAVADEVEAETSAAPPTSSSQLSQEEVTSAPPKSKEASAESTPALPSTDLPQDAPQAESVALQDRNTHPEAAAETSSEEQALRTPTVSQVAPPADPPQPHTPVVEALEREPATPALSSHETTPLPTPPTQFVEPPRSSTPPQQSSSLVNEELPADNSTTAVQGPQGSSMEEEEGRAEEEQAPTPPPKQTEGVPPVIKASPTEPPVTKAAPTEPAAAVVTTTPRDVADSPQPLVSSRRSTAATPAADDLSIPTAAHDQASTTARTAPQLTDDVAPHSTTLHASLESSGNGSRAGASPPQASAVEPPRAPTPSHSEATEAQVGAESPQLEHVDGVHHDSAPTTVTLSPQQSVEKPPLFTKELPTQSLVQEKIVVDATPIITSSSLDGDERSSQPEQQHVTLAPEAPTVPQVEATPVLEDAAPPMQPQTPDAEPSSSTLQENESSPPNAAEASSLPPHTERLASAATRLTTDGSEVQVSTDEESTTSDASSGDGAEKKAEEEYEEDEFEDVSDDDE